MGEARVRSVDLAPCSWDMLSLVRVSKRYAGRQKAAVEGVSINLSPGELVGLVGLNGAGKTTTLRVACGLSLPTRGTVEVDGLSMTRQKSLASRRVGWVPEQPAHDPFGRVGSLVDYYCDVAGGVPTRRVQTLLSEWGLTDHRRKRFRELSLGLKRRFSLVVAALTDPPYFLMDEPFNGLDPTASVQLRQWIVLARREGHGVLLSSHDLHQVQHLADRIVVIHLGRTVATLNRSELPTSSSSVRQVVLDRVDTSALRLLETFGRVSVEGAAVTLRDSRAGAAEVNASLVQAGYRVQRLSTEGEALEEYFLKLVGNGT